MKRRTKRAKASFWLWRKCPSPPLHRSHNKTIIVLVIPVYHIVNGFINKLTIFRATEWCHPSDITNASLRYKKDWISRWILENYRYFTGLFQTEARFTLSPTRFSSVIKANIFSQHNQPAYRRGKSVPHLVWRMEGPWEVKEDTQKSHN